MRFNRQLGVMTAVVALIAAACNGGTTETTIAGDAGPSSTAAQVVVTVSPNQGPSGTNATVTVTGEPNQIVIVQVKQPNGFEYQLSGSTDANGNFSEAANFSGQPGDIITITAIVGPQQDSPSSSTTFTITGTEETTTSTTTTTEATGTTEAATTTTTVASVGFSGGSVEGSINPGAAAPGQTITLSACGFLPGENVEWTFLGLFVAATANAEGCVQMMMTIPGGTPADSHPMEVSGSLGSYAELNYQTL